VRLLENKTTHAYILKYVFVDVEVFVADLGGSTNHVFLRLF
jgi:hypothetical protein